jgi:hypothetical protein
LLVFRPGDRITILAKSQARFMMLGGEPLDGPRYIWWNFVSSRRERIDQAKTDWRQARFPGLRSCSTISSGRGRATRRGYPARLGHPDPRDGPAVFAAGGNRAFHRMSIGPRIGYGTTSKTGHEQ